MKKIMSLLLLSCYMHAAQSPLLSSLGSLSLSPTVCAMRALRLSPPTTLDFTGQTMKLALHLARMQQNQPAAPAVRSNDMWKTVLVSASTVGRGLWSVGQFAIANWPQTTAIMAALGAMYWKLRGDINRVEVAVGEVHEGVGRLEEGQEILGDRVGEVQGTVARIAEEAQDDRAAMRAELERRLETNLGILNDLDEKVGGLDSKVTNLLRETTSVRKQMVTSEQFNELKERVNGLSEALIREMEQRLQSSDDTMKKFLEFQLQALRTEQQKQATVLHTGLTALSSRVDEQSVSLVDIQRMLAEQQAARQESDRRLQAVEAGQGQTHAKLDKLLKFTGSFDAGGGASSSSGGGSGGSGAFSLVAASAVRPFPRGARPGAGSRVSVAHDYSFPMISAGGDGASSSSAALLTDRSSS